MSTQPPSKWDRRAASINACTRHPSRNVGTTVGPFSNAGSQSSRNMANARIARLEKRPSGSAGSVRGRRSDIASDFQPGSFGSVSQSSSARSPRVRDVPRVSPVIDPELP